MLDESAKERLKTLTVEEVREAVTALNVCLANARNKDLVIPLTNSPWLSVLHLFYIGVPDVLSAATSFYPQIRGEVASYCRAHNSSLFMYILTVEKDISVATAKALQGFIDQVRDIYDEVVHSSDHIEKKVPSKILSGLQTLVRPNRLLPVTITKDTEIENYIHLILKDVKQLHPEVYRQYQELHRAKTGDTPLLQAVKQSVSHRYFSGNIGSFCPLYLPDILSSPQFKAMGEHPKHQLILLDMIQLCNYLAGSRNGSSIETNGFHYTWSDCHIEASEDTFQKAVKEIVSRGWFRVIGKVKRDDGTQVKLYVPSTDWKSKRLSLQDISRIHDYGIRKQKRIDDSRARYRRCQSSSGGETDTHDETGATHMTIMC